jgi:uncharacterized protein (DUF433 family)
MNASRSRAPLGDARFTVPLYTIAEAARFLGVPPSTFATWARGYVRRPPGRPQVSAGPILTSVDAPSGQPSIPFVGLTEGLVIAAFRRAGVSMQHLRRAVEVLEQEIGFEHALASKRLYTDGARVLFDYAERADDPELGHLTVVISQQRVFAEAVREHLRRITYGDDGWPVALISPSTPREVIAVDPARAFGQPIFLHGAARVEDVLDRFRAGEGLAAVAEDFGVPPEDVEDVLRASLPAAA